MESAKSSVPTEPSQALTPAAPFPSFPLDKTGCGSALTLLPTLVSASPLDVSLFYLLSRKPVLSHTLNLSRVVAAARVTLTPWAVTRTQPGPAAASAVPLQAFNPEHWRRQRGYPCSAPAPSC